MILKEIKKKSSQFKTSLQFSTRNAKYSPSQRILIFCSKFLIRIFNNALLFLSIYYPVTLASKIQSIFILVGYIFNMFNAAQPIITAKYTLML